MIAKNCRCSPVLYNGIPLPVTDVRVDYGQQPPEPGYRFRERAYDMTFEFIIHLFAPLRVRKRASKRRTRKRRLQRKWRRFVNGHHTRWMEAGRRLAARDYQPLGLTFTGDSTDA